MGECRMSEPSHRTGSHFAENNERNLQEWIFKLVSSTTDNCSIDAICSRFDEYNKRNYIYSIKVLSKRLSGKIKSCFILQRPRFDPQRSFEAAAVQVDAGCRSNCGSPAIARHR